MMFQRLFIFVFLLVLVACNQDNIAEINKIEKQIKSFEESLITFEKFSESCLIEARAKELLINDELLIKLLAFDVSLLDLHLKILITKSVFESLNGSISKDLFAELQLDLLNTMNKTSLEFTKDMLPIIENDINSLRKEKDSIENLRGL